MLVQVSCNRDRGFWRAGRFWPKGTTEAEVTTEQFSQLESERRLVVKRIKKRSDLKDVSEVQPTPPAPEETKEPVLFENPALRKRQEELLAQDADYQARKARREAQRDLPPADGAERDDETVLFEGEPAASSTVPAGVVSETIEGPPASPSEAEVTAEQISESELEELTKPDPEPKAGKGKAKK